MRTQLTPPDVKVIARSLRPIVTAGLPVSPDFSDETLLGLRGVVARSIQPDHRLSRVKALDDLLARLLVNYPDDALGEAARVLFGIAPGSRGLTITRRRERAAELIDREAEHFRKRIEPGVVAEVAWQLHRDSQNYIPRGRAVPPPLESSGDTPMIRQGDVANAEAAEHEELLSRVWAHVYALRAEILRVERLKTWPYDPTEPETSRRVLAQAYEARDYEVDAVRRLIQAYVDRYGQRITHGDAEFNAEALLRLAGWNDETMR
ncbi:hypothetical protein SAMN05443377_12245 [Propionibacterium cyclohexanicum]|uniref:Uncharacterized protein n=1 Tax=Propionibacterium cyclohexanicum TaxID=64702 RepID=A0A1H9TFY4_9ACTN|nr:hypothetical protein [Propionibacterium cyclohexanicum]SER96051.1 hypothetical protein SAMN05443377_12245 [Propionibacterium cyclohexanicum]